MEGRHKFTSAHSNRKDGNNATVSIHTSTSQSSSVDVSQKNARVKVHERERGVVHVQQDRVNEYQRASFEQLLKMLRKHSNVGSKYPPSKYSENAKKTCLRLQSVAWSAISTMRKVELIGRCDESQFSANQLEKWIIVAAKQRLSKRNTV